MSTSAAKQVGKTPSQMSAGYADLHKTSERDEGKTLEEGKRRARGVQEACKRAQDDEDKRGTRRPMKQGTESRSSPTVSDTSGISGISNISNRAESR